MSLDRSKIVPFTHEFVIKPAAAFYDPQSHFLSAVQQMVDLIIPQSLWIEKEMGENPEILICRLQSQLPLFEHTEIGEDAQAVGIIYLCPCKYTHQVRCHVIDALRKNVYPGKQMATTGGISLEFRFVEAPAQRFFIAQEILAIRNREEHHAVRMNLPDLMHELKRKLPSEWLQQAESNIHPIFMPRNEEETIRNLILLSHQIKYVRDLPQVSIHYEKQTEESLTFTVILARLLKGPIEPLRKTLQKSRLKMDIDDVRIMGYLKQKYMKEGAVLRVSIEKSPFFRVDNSVDLLRARQKIVADLTECLGELRDFNGGMILKQDEALAQLRKEIGALSHQKEFLLENYFYSLKPGIMQTVHDTSILKQHFELLNAILDSDFHLQPYRIIVQKSGKFLLCFMGAGSESCKESILNAITSLGISHRNLTISLPQLKETFAMGFILRTESNEGMPSLPGVLEGVLNEWSQRSPHT